MYCKNTCTRFNTAAHNSNPGSLSRESEALLLSLCALHLETSLNIGLVKFSFHVFCEHVEIPAHCGNTGLTINDGNTIDYLSDLLMFVSDSRSSLLHACPARTMHWLTSLRNQETINVYRKSATSPTVSPPAVFVTLH